LIPKLVDLGYIDNNEYHGMSSAIVTNFNGKNGVVDYILYNGNYTDYNRQVFTFSEHGEQCILALAAARDSDVFHEGEYLLIGTTDPNSRIEKVYSANFGWKVGHYHRRPTFEQIVSHFAALKAKPKDNTPPEAIPPTDTAGQTPEQWTPKVGDKVIAVSKSCGVSFDESPVLKNASETSQEFIYVVIIEYDIFYCDEKIDGIGNAFILSDLRPYVEQQEEAQPETPTQDLSQLAIDAKDAEIALLNQIADEKTAEIERLKALSDKPFSQLALDIHDANRHIEVLKDNIEELERNNENLGNALVKCATIAKDLETKNETLQAENARIMEHVQKLPEYLNGLIRREFK
jgi:FtsZ-binding cell division protein ZapB